MGVSSINERGSGVGGCVADTGIAVAGGSDVSVGSDSSTDLGLQAASKDTKAMMNMNKQRHI
jgi:hypothetical protein